MSLLLLFRGSFIARVIDTVNYSQHPVNCMLAGNVPLEKVRRRTTEWTFEGGPVKEVATARKTQAGRLPPMRRLSRSGWQ